VGNRAGSTPAPGTESLFTIRKEAFFIHLCFSDLMISTIPG
jgi:hypothetical protein